MRSHSTGIERAPQSVGGMIPRPLHIQGEFRQGIEPLDFHGHYHVFRIANICVCVSIIARSGFHYSPWMSATSAGLRFISTAVRHLAGQRDYIFMHQSALPYCWTSQSRASAAWV